MEQSSSELNNKQKKSSPTFYVIWFFLSMIFMYWPARVFASYFVPSTLRRFSNIFIGGGEAGEVIGALIISFVSFLIIFVLSIIVSRMLKLRLVILAFSILLVMTLILVIVGRNSANKNLGTYKDTATQELLARETAITSPNVKIVGSNLEYNNGVISFTLPSRFVLLHEAVDRENSTIIFSDHSDHITMKLYGGFNEPPICNSTAGRPPCTKNSNGVEIGSTGKNDMGAWVYTFRVFSKNSLREFYEFELQSVAYSIDGRKDPLQINSDMVNNQLKNSLNF